MEKLVAGAFKLGIKLSSAQIEQFETFYKELTDWNERMNLTAITGYEEVQTKHFLDSLTVTLALRRPFNDKTRLIDIGTGAGIPGIPLKIAFPAIRLTLLEATVKKTTFLHHVVKTLPLDGVEIVPGRAEEYAHNSEFREFFDIALGRGVAPLVSLVELTLPFCTVGGSFIAQKKEPLQREIEQARKAIRLLGGKLREVKKIELSEFADERRLVVVDKISHTAAKFPRRNGMPGKKPLL